MPAQKLLLQTLFHRRYPVYKRHVLLYSLVMEYTRARAASKPYQPFLKNQYLLYRLKGSGLTLLQTQMCKKPKNPV